MRRLLPLLLLGALLSCSATPSPVTPRPTSPCVVPAVPPFPSMEPQECGEKVCITVLETIDLARWIRSVRETATALAGCSLIKVE